MPKRVIDFDALWASDKIAACPAWAQAEYAWLYGLADASGSFELTNLRVIWGRVAAVRKDLTIERLEQIVQEFMARGLLFTWEAGGKRYGHWTGSDVPGRLPPPSWRARLERLAPALPRAELAAYMSRFASRRAPAMLPEDDGAAAAGGAQLKACLESPQGQEWDWNKEKEREDTHRCVSSSLDSEIKKEQQPLACFERAASTARARSNESASAPAWAGHAHGQGKGSDAAEMAVECRSENEPPHPFHETERVRHPQLAESAGAVLSGTRPDQYARKKTPQGASADDLLAIYQRERGSLPAAAGLTPERRRQCAMRIRAGLRSEDFGAAVRRAAATPFLAGEGARGWRASFDWFIANDTNVRKVNEGVYEPAASRAPVQAGFAMCERDRALYSELHVGTGPVAADYGARAKPEAIERARQREAARGQR